MNTAEARRILSERLAEYRPLAYSDLVQRIETVETLEVPNPGGRPWRLEFVFHWDGEPNGDVRVIGSIHNGGMRAFFPVSDSFIKSPSGEFVGESHGQIQ